MEDLVRKSIALKPQDATLRSIIPPPFNVSPIKALKENIIPIDKPSIVNGGINMNKQELLKNILKSEPLPTITQDTRIHPFLTSHSDPPKVILAEKIEDLEDEVIDYSSILLKNGIVTSEKKPPITYNINLSWISGYVEENKPDPEFVKIQTIKEIKIEEIVDQKWTLMDIVNKNPPESWVNVFKDSYKDLQRINDYLLEKERNGIIVYPLKKDIFRCLHLTPLWNVKAVIFGQDPYPGTNKSTGDPVADGLAFSSNDTRIPDSVANMYKILQKTVTGFITPNHSDLTSWAKQGILLINSSLTLDQGVPDSHKGLWSEFITRVINAIDRTNPDCIYILLGNKAQALSKLTKSKNIIMTSHPSPMGFRFGFNECNIFNQTNDILKKLNKTPIDWNL